MDEIGRVRDHGATGAMIGRVVEVVSEGTAPGADSSGFMTVAAGRRGTAGRVAPRQTWRGAALQRALGLTYSHSLLAELATVRGVDRVVLCGPKYLPVAWLWPLEAPATSRPCACAAS